MEEHRHQVPAEAHAGRAFACPRCGARLRIVRRRVVRRPRAGVEAPRSPAPARAPTPAGRRLPGGGVWWGALALLVLALVVGEVFASTVPSAPPGEPAPALTYTVDRTATAQWVTAGAGASLTLNASGQVTAVTLRGKKTTDGVLRAQVALKDTKGNILATGRGVLPSDSGDFALTVGMEPATIPYSRVAEVAVAYTR
ncbi:MAG: hypothetical protein NZ951_04190 [Dehalococcoidia bacterium]|nr:hypothetical protein [Dehalococcoidia bacterium]MDW8119636.1 hypothetical protein [Chloroflexota bacterium]